MIDCLPVTLLDGFDDVLIRPVPVWSLTVGHDLPTDDAETPDIRRGCEFAEGNRLGSSPPDWNFTALEMMKYINQFLHWPMK